MAAVAHTRAESTTCSLNILAGAALDSNECVRVNDSSSKRKRPSREMQAITYSADIQEPISMPRQKHPGLVYDDLDPMLMASDPEVNLNSQFIMQPFDICVVLRPRRP
jgi:hypothetical protein